MFCFAINETADSDKPVQVEYAAPDDARILLGKGHHPAGRQR